MLKLNSQSCPCIPFSNKIRVAPLIRVCQDDDFDSNMDTSCSGCGIPKLINLISLMMDISFQFISRHLRFPFLRQLSNHFPLFLLEDPSRKISEDHA
ncbi:unnamed protein product [Lactuca virosa]|uniref:Uncharacterized protein n=1 Tax=Lactuca virosa TaxID=75947 RepID=A0AAU9M2J4_9ASTR|nr:unnamed protein product [Lactuca virosa]